jgi:hypothetical protein
MNALNIALDDGDWRFSSGFIGKLERECRNGCSVKILVNQKDANYFVVTDYIPDFGIISRVLSSSFFVFMLLFAALMCLGICVMTWPILETLVGDVEVEARAARMQPEVRLDE